MPISSNDAVDTYLEKLGIALTHTKIGSPYVIAAMNEAIAKGSSRVVSWEVNGGFLLGTDFSLAGGTLQALPTRDSILPILCALLSASQQNTSLSELFLRLPSRYT